jgi:molybdate transport system substrate-binding protein
MKKAMTLKFVSLIGLLLPLAASSSVPGQSDPSPRETILVFAAASTTNALDEIRQAFQQRTGICVQSSYASSGTLAQQIVNGAQADVFLSADEKWAEYLTKQELASRQQNLLANRLVVVVPADSQLQLQRVEDLTAGEIKHLAMGDPDGVPAGEYGRQALTELRLWERLKGKVVSAEDVRHALVFVETGAAEVGIVYATDAAISKKVKVALEIPPRLSSPIRYPVVLLTQGANKPAAVQFYDYLRSPAAGAVFRKHGFTVLEPDPRPRP